MNDSAAVTNGSSNPFNARVMLWVIGAAILSFVGYVMLSAYAPEMKRGEDGRGHAFSRSAIGYAGIIALRDDIGRSPNIIRDQAGLATSRLVVVTPEADHDPDVLGKLIRDRGDNPTLIILPKHQTVPSFEKKGWVQASGQISESAITGILSDVVPVTVNQQTAKQPERYESDWAPTVTFAKGQVVQTISGERLEPYITSDDGKILLAGVRRQTVTEDEDDDYTPVYILSDPDVINNLGIGNRQMAYAATSILDELSTDKTKEVNFDVTLNGFEGSRNLLKLAFEPPFLALSICLFVASLMVLANGLMRFGPPLGDVRAIAPGKGALVANTADLLRQAGIEHEVGGRYAALTRDTAAHALGLPPGMSADVVTERLDRVSRTGPTFSQVARGAEQASNSYDLLAAARALYHWRKEETG